MATISCLVVGCVFDMKMVRIDTVMVSTKMGGIVLLVCVVLDIVVTFASRNSMHQILDILKLYLRVATSIRLLLRQPAGSFMSSFVFNAVSDGGS